MHFQLSPFPMGTRQFCCRAGDLFSTSIIIPLACGTPPCKQRGELLVAVIEQLFLLCISAVPFPKGDETALLSGGGCHFVPALFLSPLACGTHPCKQRGELLVAVIEQLFLPMHFSCPLSQGGRDSLLSGGGYHCACTVFIPLACGTPPCKQRGELLVAVIEQLFLLCISAVPFPKGDETALLSGGG